MTPTYTHYVCNSSTTLNLRNLMNKTLEASPSTSQLPWEEWPVELQPAIWDVYPFLYTCALWIFQISRRKPPLDLWNLLITWMIHMVQGFFKSTLCTYSIHACISLCIISHIYIYIIYTCVTTTSSISPDSYRFLLPFLFTYKHREDRPTINPSTVIHSLIARCPVGSQ